MTNAELAILGLIAEQPRHGYEIEQIIEMRGMRQWTEIGFSSIYYLLKKLEREELVSSNIVGAAGRGPARRRYHITSDGREALQSGTFEALAQPHAGNLSFQVGLANLPVITPLQALLAVQKNHAQLTESLQLMLARRNEQRPLPPHVEELFSMSETLMQAQLTWMEGFIQRLKQPME